MRFSRRHLVPTVLALVGLGILLDHLIVTDVEAIEALAERAETAARERDFETLEGLLSESFRYDGRDRARTVAYVKSQVQRITPQKVGFNLDHIQVEGDRATARAHIVAEAMGSRILLTAEIELARTEEGWRLDRVGTVQPGWGTR